DPPMLRIESATILCDGQATPYLQMGGELALAVTFAADTPIQQPRIGLVIATPDGERLINTNNRFQRSDQFDRPVRQGSITCSLGRVPLVGGRYGISLFLGDQAHDSHVIENAIWLEVTERDIWGSGRVPPSQASRLWWPTTFHLEAGHESR